MGETLDFFDGRTSLGRCGCVARIEAHYGTLHPVTMVGTTSTGTMHGRCGGREDLVMDAVGYSIPTTHEAIPEGIVFLHIMDLLSTMPCLCPWMKLFNLCPVKLT